MSVEQIRCKKLYTRISKINDQMVAQIMAKVALIFAKRRCARKMEATGPVDKKFM